MGKYQTWDDIEKTYPNKWIILGDVQYTDDGALLGGTVIERCTDDTVDAAIIKYRKQKKNYLHLRTSTYFNNGVQVIC